MSRQSYCSRPDGCALFFCEICFSTMSFCFHFGHDAYDDSHVECVVVVGYFEQVDLVEYYCYCYGYCYFLTLHSCCRKKVELKR